MRRDHLHQDRVSRLRRRLPGAVHEELVSQLHEVAVLLRQEVQSVQRKEVGAQGDHPQVLAALRHVGHGGLVEGVVHVLGAAVVQRDEHHDAPKGDEAENPALHPQKPKQHEGIQAHKIQQLLLPIHLNHRLQPAAQEAGPLGQVRAGTRARIWIHIDVSGHFAVVSVGQFQKADIVAAIRACSAVVQLPPRFEQHVQDAAEERRHLQGAHDGVPAAICGLVVVRHADKPKCSLGGNSSKVAASHKPHTPHFFPDPARRCEPRIRGGTCGQIS
mmetsp:Transcript_8009/g.29964  ORF Transcript_8009/g.29964 Transcript_8009/m.29964 type:complete len:273 (-) Transcript_8009:45-863(-)